MTSGLRRRLEMLEQGSAARTFKDVLRKLDEFYPDAGPYRRELYQKHIQFFAAGTSYMERLFMAANRVGKSEAGAFEGTLHATGLYPYWWTGRRFDHPTEGWACGTTGQTVRDIVQVKLVGPPTAPGTGMIPADLIVRTQRKTHGLQIRSRPSTCGMSAAV